MHGPLNVKLTAMNFIPYKPCGSYHVRCCSFPFPRIFTRVHLSDWISNEEVHKNAPSCTRVCLYMYSIVAYIVDIFPFWGTKR